MARAGADLRGPQPDPSEELAELLIGIGDVIEPAGGRFTMGYAAVVVTATTLEARGPG